MAFAAIWQKVSNLLRHMHLWCDPSCVADGETRSRGGTQDEAGDSVSVDANAETLQSITQEAKPELPRSFSEFRSMCDLYPPYKIYDIDFYGGDQNTLLKNLWNYYSVCIEHSSPYANMIVTTSCFTQWRKGKKSNGCAKVIPAMPMSADSGPSGKPTRVFFFDDNINLHFGGAVDSEGICNLRDLTTGEFVAHGEGQNGFKSERFFRQTTVQHSTDYRVVLIQVNILDVMIHPNFFTQIIARYAEPGESLLCFFDVNGVLVWDDTAADQTVAEVLLKTMFRLVEFRPRAGLQDRQFVFEEWPPTTLDKPENGKSMVARIHKGNNDKYHTFWEIDRCKRFLDEVAKLADIAWGWDSTTLTVSSFFEDYDRSKKEIEGLQGSAAKDGIPDSWPIVFNYLREHGHTAVLNSFGADTHRAVKRVVPELQQVVQLTVNYEMWGERDVVSWGKQFAP